jgi:oligopeptide transport system ATP-binding protein
LRACTPRRWRHFPPARGRGASAMHEPVLDVVGLRRVYRGHGREPEHIAVDEVSFSLDAGAATAIVGNSGSGKTTTLHVIAGLDHQTAGEVIVCGNPRPPHRVSAKARRQRARETQLVFQDPYTYLDPRRRVVDELGAVLDLHFGLRRTERTARIAELLDRVGLSERHAAVFPRALSGGERQRVAIARALAAEPRILLLDEPVASLDVSIQAQILNLLSAVRAATGIAVLLVTHDLAVARYVCDEVLVMSDGRIIERGATETIFAHPSDPYTKLLLRSIPGPGWRPERTRQSVRP